MKIHIHGSGNRGKSTDTANSKDGLTAHLAADHSADPAAMSGKSFNDLRLAHSSFHIQQGKATMLEAKDEAALLKVAEAALAAAPDKKLAAAIEKLRNRAEFRRLGGVTLS